MYIAALLLLGYCIAIASGQSNGEVRLAVNGSASRSITAGRVRVYLQGQWSNICNEEFGIEEANTVCHQLGYDRALEYSTASSDRFGIDDHPTLMNNVRCDNNSLHILQCSYSITMNCSNNNDMSVTCSTTPIWTSTYLGALRLLEGFYPSRGRLEVYLLTTYSWNTVCDDLFGQDEADTACRQLGYTHASRYDHISGIYGTGSSTSEYTCCSSSTSCFRSCYCEDTSDLKKRRVNSCSHLEDVTLQCEFDENFKDNAGRRNQCDYSLTALIVGASVGGTFGFIILLAIILTLIGVLCGKCQSR